MTFADRRLDVFPSDGRSRSRHQAGFAKGEFLFLPLVDRHVVRIGREVVPQVFDQLQLFGGREVEERLKIDESSWRLRG